MSRRNIKIIKLIEKQVKDFRVPLVTAVSKKHDPYLVLVSCILSLRTKDKTTVEASERLFQAAATPEKMVKLSLPRLTKLIYPVGFYRNKAKFILGISRKLLSDFRGKVPSSLEGLLTLKGVGRKTANLVLGLGYNIAAICVDTHVHRISNRLGWVKTETAQETEYALQRIMPKDYWIGLNTTMVTFGQNVCLPVSPLCSRCFVYNYCRRVEVKKHRS